MRPRKHLSTPKILQPSTRRHRSVFIFLLLPAFVTLLVWYAFEQGKIRAGYDKTETVRRISRLKSKITVLQDNRVALRQRVALLESSAQVEQAALAGVKQQLEQFHRQHLVQEKELAFLRGILTSDAKHRGLRIQGFRLGATADDHIFKYWFTLSRVLDDARVSVGRILIRIDGIETGRTKSLSLKEVGIEQADSLEMRFKYFQNVEGLVQLPEGFLPNRFTIEVKPKDKKRAPVVKTFDWELTG